MAKRIHKRRFLALTMIAAILLSLLAGCSNDTPAPTDPTEPSQVQEEAPLTVTQRSLLLDSGEGVQLEAEGPSEITFTSSNPDVATVDAGGYVQAVGKGNAMIAITGGGETAYCGVIVDSQGTMIGIAEKKANVLFSDMILYQPTEINGMAYDAAANSFYFSQPYGTSSYDNLVSDIIVSKVDLVKNETDSYWAKTGWMRFYESGYGYLTAENDGNGTKLWLESNGDYYGYGTSVSLIDWENGGYGQGEYGQTLVLPDLEGSLLPVVDAQNDLLAVYVEEEKTYYFYDRQDLLDGNAGAYLHKAVCEGRQEPAAGVDDSQGRYNASLRGAAIHDGYIYQVSGNSSIYVSVFDMDGNLQYCHRVTDFSDMETRIPRGITCVDGKLYLTIASGSTSCYFANVWVYE